MGMDVHGKTNEAYFRRNVWGWHGLASYVQDMHADLADKVEHWHSNDGDGLGEEDSRELARRLREDVKSGAAQQYVDSRNDRLGRLPRVVCDICHGTGLRTDAAGVQWGYDKRTMDAEGTWRGGCNGCAGTGTRDAWDLSYYLDVNDVVEFAQFLEECDGFEIW